PRRRLGAAPLPRRRLADAALRAVRAAFGALCRIACRSWIATEALATRTLAHVGRSFPGARLPGRVERGPWRGTTRRRDRPAAKVPLLRGKTRSRPDVAAPFQRRAIGDFGHRDRPPGEARRSADRRAVRARVVGSLWPRRILAGCPVSRNYDCRFSLPRPAHLVQAAHRMGAALPALDRRMPRAALHACHRRRAGARGRCWSARVI